MQDSKRSRSRRGARPRAALSWLRELPTQLNEIERCHAEGDAAAVGKVAHAIKGTDGTVGLPAFTSIGEALERADGGSISLVLSRARTLCHKTFHRRLGASDDTGADAGSKSA